MFLQKINCKLWFFLFLCFALQFWFWLVLCFYNIVRSTERRYAVDSDNPRIKNLNFVWAFDFASSNLHCFQKSINLNVNFHWLLVGSLSAVSESWIFEHFLSWIWSFYKYLVMYLFICIVLNIHWFEFDASLSAMAWKLEFSASLSFNLGSM